MLSFVPLLAVLLGSCTSAAEAQSSEVPDANPSRPSLTGPAELTPVGYLQFETGILRARDSLEFASRLSWTQALKLSFTEWAEALLLAEPVVGSQGDKTREGDAVGGVQICPLCSSENGPHVAVAYERTLHTGSASNLDIGGFVQSGTLLVSVDALGLDIDVNGFWNEQEQDGSHKTQTGQSISVTRTEGDFDLTAELWRFTQPFVHSKAAGALLGASYNLRRNIVLDFAVTRGLTGTSTKWQFTAGFTYLLPQRLWKAPSKTVQ